MGLGDKAEVCDGALTCNLLVLVYRQHNNLPTDQGSHCRGSDPRTHGGGHAIAWLREGAQESMGKTKPKRGQQWAEI